MRRAGVTSQNTNRTLCRATDNPIEDEFAKKNSVRKREVVCIATLKRYEISYVEGVGGGKGTWVEGRDRELGRAWGFFVV